MNLLRDRSFNLNVGSNGLEFNEEHFAPTPIEMTSDRGSRIDGELEELYTYARILSNLKEKVITPIQDIILTLDFESPGLRCVKRICSQLTVIEEMVVKFHKYSVQFFKNTTIGEERRIFKNCASCLNAIIKAWEEYLVAYAEADAFEAFEEVTRLPQSKAVIEGGYREFSDVCNYTSYLTGSIHKEPILSRILSLKLSCLLLIIHEERASIVVLSNELSLSVDAQMEKDEADFNQSCDKLARLTEKKRNLQNQVEATRKFWSEHPKLLNCLEVKSIKKLIMLSSKERKLSYLKWSSYSIGFVLFQDSLLKFTIDFLGNYEAQVLPLNLLWVYASKSKPESRLQIQLIAPEVHLVLQCSSQDDRDYWVRAINEATIDYLCVPRQETTNKHLGAASSLFWPPPVRKGSYTFAGGQYQSAKYTGAWLEGKQHGRGTIVWLDGKAFVGYFRKGLYHGRGKLSMPHTSDNNGKRLEVYEGQFEEGLYHGFGVLCFTNGNNYEGEWYRGQRHGHGRYHLIRDNQYSTYIGEWANGKRNGFGVENATDAEKSYHGMWKDDVREGQGFTITTGDQYCACRFRDNMLAGRGFIINGQGKSYEGWLSGTMGLNGIGELRLGDDTVISGTFSGKWDEWVKVGSELRLTSGFISKQEVARKSVRLDYISWEGKALKYSATSQAKWCSLFDKCKLALHLVEKELESPTPSQLFRSKSGVRKPFRDEQDSNIINRNNTMNHTKPTHNNLTKSHTLIGYNRTNSSGVLKAKKHSFDITVGPVTEPTKVSSPIDEDIRRCLTPDLKGGNERWRSKSNPEEYLKRETSQVTKIKFKRINSLILSIDSSQIVEVELPTPSISPNSKPSHTTIESEPDSSFEISSFNPSSASTSQELMLLESSSFTDSQIIINDIKKNLFDQLNTYCSSNTHPLGKLVRDLKDVIFESYAGIGASQYLLPHAIQDTKVFLEKLAEIVQKFAPFMIDDKAKLHGMIPQEFIEENIHIIDVYFLSDLFIPRIYHTLFTLFSLFQQKNDSQYETAVSLLSFIRCNDLMTLFSIDSFPFDPDWHKQPSQMLATISQEYTIQGKLNIIKRSVNTMLENLKDCNNELTTDVIIPYFQIVIIYARVKKMSTQLHYIYTFMDPRLSQGEFGFLLTLLEGCYMMLSPDKLPCCL